EVVDLGVRATPIVARREALDAFHQHSAIPAAVVHGEAARARDMPPEAPEVVLGSLLWGGSADRDHAVLAGVQRGDHASDGASFPRGIPPLEHEDTAEPRLAHFTAELVQPA